MKLPIWFYLLQWITVSCVMILMNKAILSPWKFSYPLFLTSWHMLFATFITQIMSKTTTMLTAVDDNKIGIIAFRDKIVPIAACFSLSLMLGNLSFLYLSVSFIQMLKAFTPIAVFVISVIAKLEKPSLVQFAIVLVISLGVAISTEGELKFSAVGFLFQILGICAESVRLVMADKLLKDYKLDPLSTLYYIAPTSFVFIFLGFMVFESDAFPWERLMGPFAWVLIANGLVSFGLNVAIVLLISNTSAMTLTVGGILKDVLLVFLSVEIFSSPVSLMQVFGYGVSLSAMTAYKNFKADPEGFTQSLVDTIGSATSLCFRSSLRRVASAPFSATDDSPDFDSSTDLLEKGDKFGMSDKEGEGAASADTSQCLELQSDSRETSIDEIKSKSHIYVIGRNKSKD